MSFGVRVVHRTPTDQVSPKARKQADFAAESGVGPQSVEYLRTGWKTLVSHLDGRVVLLCACRRRPRMHAEGHSCVSEKLGAYQSGAGAASNSLGIDGGVNSLQRVSELLREVGRQ
jgi:hypothetical protein